MPVPPFLGTGGAGATGSLNLGAVLATWLPVLHVQSIQDLESATWTEAELFREIDQALTALYRSAELRVDSLSFGPVIDPLVTLPARLVRVLHVAVGGVSMRPATVAEVEALAGGLWRSQTGNPKRWLHEHDGARGLRIWPAPVAQMSVLVLALVAPDEVTAASYSPAVPKWVGDAALCGAFAELMKRESDAAMPEVAQRCAVHAGIYRQAAAGLYGAAM
jgi:hypothetical protein